MSDSIPIQIDLSRFRDAYFEEANGHIADMESGLLQLEDAPDDEELLNSIFRGAHSIKGASGTFGLTEIASFTHSLENVLERLRDREMRATGEIIDLLLRSVDFLKTQIAAAQDEETIDANEGPLDELKKLLGTPQESPAAATPPAEEAGGDTQGNYRIEFIPGDGVLRQGMDPITILKGLARLGDIRDLTLDLGGLPPLKELKPESSYLAWSLTLITDQEREEIEDVFEFIMDLSKVVISREGDQAEKKAPAAAADPSGDKAAQPPRPGKKTERRSGKDRRSGESSIRVSTDKVDKLIDLVGELVIAQSMLVQTAEHFTEDKLPKLKQAISIMERSTRELQERVMSVRMLPIGSVFGRFPRMVRDLANSFNKKIHLEIIGEETEIDKGMVERIGDPLTHLIRNSIDHGLEPPDERVAKGKPETGTVTLRALHEGGNIVVEVIDDGRGLDPEKLRDKGISKGLIQPGDELTDDQLCNLIFQPGFSTAAKITDVSGRGMGMDIVKETITDLNGSIQIVNNPGQGICFRIRLPLTLAILDGLLLGVGDQVYVLPLTAIEETLRPKKEHVKTLLGNAEVVIVRNESLPLLRLHRLFNTSSKVVHPWDGLVVIIETEEGRMGLLVDAVLGQSQVVIKSLELNYKKVEGIVGATILGDGQVALILDIQGLVRLSKPESLAA